MNFKEELQKRGYKPKRKLTYEDIKNKCLKVAICSNYTFFSSDEVNEEDMSRLVDEGLNVEYYKGDYEVSWK